MLAYFALRGGRNFGFYFKVARDCFTDQERGFTIDQRAAAKHLHALALSKKQHHEQPPAQ